MEEKENGEELFVEIRPEIEAQLPRLVEVYVAQVEPCQCRTLLKALSNDMPLGKNESHLFDLTHLKRVKKFSGKQKSDDNKSPSKKKQQQS